MSKRHIPESHSAHPNVTPLIDIIMCLIIFFMLVTKIGVSRGVDKDILLPSTILGTPITNMGDTLSLNVHYLPSSDVPQVTTMVGSDKKELKLQEGSDRPLERVLKEFKKVHAEKTKIIVRGDQDLTYGQLEKVLISISNAGITDTAYETKLGTDTSAAPAVAQ